MTIYERLKIVRLGYQAKRKPSEQELSAWEIATGLKLPGDYRNFLLAWNGGTVFPYVFTHRYPQATPTETELILDVLCDWDDVLDNSRLQDALHLRSLPPQHLVIGSDPCSVYVLISLAPDTYGHIMTWYKNYYFTWGEPENDQLGEVAPSFSAFIGSLKEGKPDDYHAYWSTIT
jgi:hypothetical protein